MTRTSVRRCLVLLCALLAGLSACDLLSPKEFSAPSAKVATRRPATPRPPAPAASRGQHFSHLSTILDRVQAFYPEVVTDEKLMLGACKGVVAELDPYSQYMTPEDVQQLLVDTEGEFGGLGIEITLDEQRVLTVITPLEGTPAIRAGVLPGDRIVEIEGKSTYRMTVLDAVKVLRGKAGTKITLTVVHKSQRKRETITIVRDIIKIESLRAAAIVDSEARVGYIRLTNFQKNTPERLDLAVRGLLGRGMKALVLDLRRNPGGLLDSAVKVTDRFLDSGTIVSTRGRTPQANRTFEATREGTYPSFPLAVLVSPYSASASEIFAGAVRDHRRGILIGRRTFGKGSVQSILPLDGGARLRLTTAKYHTPSGRSIHRGIDAREDDPWGIMPDVVVEASDEDELALVKHWQQQRVQENFGPTAAAKDGFVDRALVRAIEILREALERPDTLAARLRGTRPTPTARAALPSIGAVTQRWAVIIGVTSYQFAGSAGLKNLRYAARDARALHEQLAAAPALWPKDNVRLVTDEQATKRGVATAVLQFLKKAQKDDLVLIFFAGHGAPDPERPKNNYLLCHDTDPTRLAATGFPMWEVENAIERGIIEARRVVVLADACHSGGFAPEGMRDIKVVSRTVAVGIQSLAKGVHRRVVTSCEPGELSQEKAEWGGGHGAFAHALIQGLRGAADATADKNSRGNADGSIDLDELVHYVRRTVGDLTSNGQHVQDAGRLNAVLVRR